MSVAEEHGNEEPTRLTHHTVVSDLLRRGKHGQKFFWRKIVEHSSKSWLGWTWRKRLVFFFKTREFKKKSNMSSIKPIHWKVLEYMKYWERLQILQKYWKLYLCPWKVIQCLSWKPVYCDSYWKNCWKMNPRDQSCLQDAIDYALQSFP